jgi:hypothetical protein
VSDDINKTPCPRCGAIGTLHISVGLEASNVALPGAQMKVGATARPVLVCTACTLRLRGRFDGHHAVFEPPAATDTS